MSHFHADTPLALFEAFGGKASRTSDGNPNGVHVQYPNGWTVSIQWGLGTYSGNRDAPFDRDSVAPPSPTAEVACWRAKRGMRKHSRGMAVWDDGDIVSGWRSWDEVQRLLEMAARPSMREPILLPHDADD